jgi:CoA:oxalate CoA-transferase
VRLPTADCFPTKAGDVLMSVLTDAQTKALCAELGRPDLLDDPRFATRDQRMANHGAMRAELVAAFATDCAENWERRLAQAGVPIAEVSTIPKAINHPQLAHRGVIFDMAAPRGFDGPIKGVGTGFVATTDGPAADRPPPALGEHTDAILAEAGYSATEIRELRQEGVAA